MVGINHIGTSEVDITKTKTHFRAGASAAYPEGHNDPPGSGLVQSLVIFCISQSSLHSKHQKHYLH